jgi:glutathione synthase/RimK-type ligase-like ATP-grasp enzyme
MPTPTYIVISGHDDSTIKMVERHMDQPFLLVDTRDILQGKALTYRLTNGKTAVSWGDRPLEHVKSVWYRRLMLVQGFELPVHKDRQLYAQRALRYYNMLLFAQFPKALWLSDFYITERADDKLWQLQQAASVGFNVPDTIFTASPLEAKAFVERHKQVIAKPNYSSVFQKDGKEYGFYTSRVDSNTDFSGFGLAPAILQTAIDVRTELRITVVDKQVFAAAVKQPSEETGHIRDWRVAHINRQAHFYPFELPKDIQDTCLSLLNKLGLRYGALDVIVDKTGKYWFLENNPNGQWGFIEDETGLPISKAIADFLMTGTPSDG